MISSMTGYGRGEFTEGQHRITIEMRSVNNRYLDMNIRMPKKLAAFENRIRQTVKEVISRGKIDIFVTWESYGDGETYLSCNEALAADYFDKITALADRLGIDGTLRAVDIARLPDVFRMEEDEGDEESLWHAIEVPLKDALAAFRASRILEGEKLRKDLMEKLEVMSGYAAAIEAREPQILAEYRERLMAKVREILGDHSIDEARLATEVVLYADKICTDEETVRLRSHIDAMKKELAREGSIGRKLDFLAQEMNREANTILSKSSDLQTSDTGIALKTDIEKVREQIQNIE